MIINELDCTVTRGRVYPEIKVLIMCSLHLLSTYLIYVALPVAVDSWLSSYL